MEPEITTEPSGLISQKDLLALAGQLAEAARMVVGGKDLNGFETPPATTRTLTNWCRELEHALCAYDRAILHNVKLIAKAERDAEKDVEN